MRRREQEQLADLLEEQAGRAQETSNRCRDRIDAMKRKRAAAEHLLNQLAAREYPQAAPRRSGVASGDGSGAVFHRVGRFRHRAERALAEAEAFFELENEDDSLAQEDDLAAAVELELLELKQRHAGPVQG